ncbi:unnamed protein product [marine sediment metagenome]|uniref:Methyltransferase domain-containing protein n=1 Tax=marine sediment metagenome TaxID=412755 RepID=X1FM86_9ZZZZ
MDTYSFGLGISEEEGKCMFDSLTELSKHFDPINIVEVGCREFKTGYTLCKICKDLSKNYNYSGIDIVRRDNILPEHMHFILGDANDEILLEQLPDKFHFVFIDPCHCKECVLNQIDIYTKRLVDGGIIAFHDSGINSQGLAMSESHDTSKDLRVGVKEALRIVNLESKGYKVFRKVENSPKGIICLQK